VHIAIAEELFFGLCVLFPVYFWLHFSF